MNSRFWVGPMLVMEETADYVEDHRGIPLIPKVWMRMCRMATAFIVMNVSVATPLIVSHIAPYPYDLLFKLFASLTLAIVYMTNSILYAIPKYDVFQPLGFHLFKWTITQR